MTYIEPTPTERISAYLKQNVRTEGYIPTDNEQALDRLLGAALYKLPEPAVSTILADHARVMRVLKEANPFQIKPRFSITDPTDPDHPGLLDSTRPGMVASWADIEYEDEVRSYLSKSTEEILEDTSWDARSKL